MSAAQHCARRGTEENVSWLLKEHPRFRVVRADTRTNRQVLDAKAAQCDVLLHLAVQVAVTSSVADPRTDFEINALGSLNVFAEDREVRKGLLAHYREVRRINHIQGMGSWFWAPISMSDITVLEPIPCGEPHAIGSSPTSNSSGR